MSYQPTTALRKVASLTKKIRAIQGGTSASKTISVLMLLIHLAQSDKEPTLASVVSESVPHLKRGAIRDFKNIMISQHYWSDSRWNATDSIYTFETGSQVEFFSADNADKLRGGRRDRLFMNEANNMTLDAFDQLEVRTKEFVFLDWNPTVEFWFYTEVMPRRNDCELIILTYKDNEALSPEIISSIEQRRDRKAWFKVYGEGQLGDVEGRIYKGWIVVDEVPDGALLSRRGLDYGYTNDPTAVVDVYKYQRGYLLDEVLYQKGLGNKAIADVLLAQDAVLTVGDSSEPKSNDELKLYGVSIVGAAKGPGSVNQGIQLIQNSVIYVTKRSVNLLKEYRSYLWLTDKAGKIINTPQDWDNHALDAARYAISSMNPVEEKKVEYEWEEDAPYSAEIGI